MERSKIFLKDIVKRYKDQTILFSIECLELTRNLYFFTGQNGSGKSVFLRGLCGIEMFEEGTMEISGENFLYLTDRPVGFDYLTIIENIELIHKLHGVILNPENLNQVYERKQLNVLTRNASLGMQMKIGCSLLYIKDHWDIIVLDETLATIDKESRAIIYNLLNQRASERTCAIVVTHHELPSPDTLVYTKLTMNKEGIRIV